MRAPRLKRKVHVGMDDALLRRGPKPPRGARFVNDKRLSRRSERRLSAAQSVRPTGPTRHAKMDPLALPTVLCSGHLFEVFLLQDLWQSGELILVDNYCFLWEAFYLRGNDAPVSVLANNIFL